MEKEYIVTLKNRSDLDDFYTDMEASTGSGHIPDHSCHCDARRQISRNTHYHLTEAEAIELRKDPRVVAVELPIGELGGSIGFDWDDPQTGNWDRSPDSTTDKNWGLKRCIDSVNASNNHGGWGSDTSGNWGSFSQVTETINTTSSGKNVDVVIADTNFGTMNGAHPEFAVNPDGTGGSRFVYLDWFGSDFSSIISSNGLTNYPDISTYNYDRGVNDGIGNPTNANHGVHVAGTVAGNTQGWARDANIYSIAPSYYGFTPSTVSIFYTAYMDFIRHWHNSVKSINSATGRKNPTLVNQSWGIYWANFGQHSKLNTLSQVVYQGTTTDVTGYSASEKRKFLEDCGIAVGIGYDSPTTDSIRRLPMQSAAVQADNEDAMDDGIIICNAAGNSSYNTEVENGTNWNNSLRFSNINQGNPVFYTRGTVAGHTPGSIQVGATGAKGFVKEYKAGFSTYGPRVQIWAPGENIMSSISSGGSPDPRDSNYRINSYSGTSMASPQVCGVLACLMEQEPNLTQPEAVQHLIETSKADQMNDYAIAAETVGFGIGLYTTGGNTYYTVSGYDRKSNPGNNGDLFVYKGDTIYFSLQNLTGHPFYIKTSPTTGTGDQISSTWLTGTGSQGGTTGTLIWDTNANGSSGIYYYQCGNHASMGGRIVIIDIGDAANTDGNHQSFEFEKWSSSNNNRHLHYQKKRPESGSIFPHPNYKNRNESTAGVKYPRSNVTVTKAS